MKSTKVERFISILIIFSLITTGFLGLFINFGTENVSAAGPTYRSGHISQNQIWSATNSPYIIIGNLWLDQGFTITIQAGTTVEFDDMNGFYKFEVNGTLNINGVSGNEVSIKCNYNLWAGNWKEVRLNSDNNVIEYCDFMYANTAIVINNSVNNRISNCNFSYNYKGMELATSDDNIIEDCEFWQNSWYGIQMHTSNYNNVTGSYFSRNDEIGTYLEFSNNNRFSNNFLAENGNLGRARARASFLMNMRVDSSNYNLIENCNFTISYGSGLRFGLGSSNNTVESCEFYQNWGEEIYLTDARDIYLLNSTIYDTDIWNNHIELDAASHIYVINTTFDKAKVRMFDAVSKLTVQWFLNLQVTRFAPSVPIPNANIVVKDSKDQEILNSTTNPNGEYNNIICTAREQTGMAINDTFTPHNVSAEKLAFLKGYANPEPLMTANLDLDLKLHKIPIDYVIIRDGPNGTGTEVMDRLYYKGNTSLFYAACYNNGLGFIGDLPSVWNSNDTAVATVTQQKMPQSPTAILEAIENGTANITATHEGVTDYTGVITVEAWNLAPVITGIPNQILNEDQVLDNAIDLWTYAVDPETSDQDLIFSIIGNTNPDCGVSLDSNQYLDITPTEHWWGSSDITIEVFDGYNKYDNDAFIIIVNPVNDAPELLNGKVVPVLGDIVTLFNYTVTYLDIEDEAPDFVNVAIDGQNHSMVPADTSDLIYVDGKNYYFVTSLSPGSEHTYQFFTSDGIDEVSTGLATNPVVVAPDLALTDPDIILSDDSQTIVNGTDLTIQATIHNIGDSAVINIVVRFELKSQTRAFEDWTAIGPDKIIDNMAPNSAKNVSLNWIATPPGNYSLRVTIDPADTIPELNESNNGVEQDLNVGPDEDVLSYYEIIPASWTMDEGDTKQFKVKGYDFYGNDVPVTVTWAVNGGGTIDATGTFKAELWGDWEIYGNYSGMSVIATVHVKQIPVEASKIIVIPSKWIMVINTTKLFEAKAYDLDDIEVKLDLEWEMETTGGTIDPTGLFTAQQRGEWVINAKYQTPTAEIVGSAIVRVLLKDEKVTEDFSDPDSNIGVTANVGGSGSINVSEIAKPNLDIPKDLNDVGIFIDITKSETLELEWMIIKIPLDDFNLPKDVDPESIKMYYYEDGEWILIEDTWVDGYAIYANVTHLTIFAPMAESAEKEAGSEEDEDNTMLYVVVAIIIIVIVILVLGILIRKRRPSEKERLEVREEEEAAEEPKIDLDELKPKRRKCRKCGEKLEVPVSEDEKVSIKCDECGARRRIKNPYLAQIEALREKQEQDLKKSKKKSKRADDEFEDWDTDEDEDDDKLEWAEDEVEEPVEEVEPVDEFEDWDKTAEEHEEAEAEAVEEFEEPAAEEDEELPDWDDDQKPEEEEDEFDDWDAEVKAKSPENTEEEDVVEDWDGDSDTIVVHYPKKS